jgi:hypothetical protein
LHNKLCALIIASALAAAVFAPAGAQTTLRERLFLAAADAPTASAPERAQAVIAQAFAMAASEGRAELITAAVGVRTNYRPRREVARAFYCAGGCLMKLEP